MPFSDNDTRMYNINDPNGVMYWVKFPHPPTYEQAEALRQQIKGLTVVEWVGMDKKEEFAEIQRQLIALRETLAMIQAHLHATHHDT